MPALPVRQRQGTPMHLLHTVVDQLLRACIVQPPGAYNKEEAETLVKKLGGEYWANPPKGVISLECLLAAKSPTKLLEFPHLRHGSCAPPFLQPHMLSWGALGL